jgi:large subunit ribosomal protein L21
VPKPDNSPLAVIVSGGKQYRVAPGDRILVDRISAEPGSAVKIARVLMFSNGDDFKVGNPAVEGLDVDAKVIAHRRGPRIESIRYHSKKRVRVHHGGRADLTALEIIAVGGVGVAEPDAAEEKKPAAKKARGRAKPAPKAKAEPAAAVAEANEPEAEAPAKKTATRRRTKKEAE